ARKGRGVIASPAAPASSRPRALVLAGHEPTIDPRIEWMAEGLARDFEVCELGVDPLPRDGRRQDYERLSDWRVRVRVWADEYRHKTVPVPHILTMNGAGAVALQHLMLLRVLAGQSTKSLEAAIGALDATEEDLS